MEVKKLSKYSKEKLEKLGSKKFKCLMGVNKHVFDKAVETFTIAYNKRHEKGGRPSDFTCYEMVIIMLLYIKRYIQWKTRLMNTKFLKS